MLSCMSSVLRGLSRGESDKVTSGCLILKQIELSRIHPRMVTEAIEFSGIHPAMVTEAIEFSGIHPGIVTEADRTLSHSPRDGY